VSFLVQFERITPGLKNPNFFPVHICAGTNVLSQTAEFLASVCFDCPCGLNVRKDRARFLAFPVNSKLALLQTTWRVKHDCCKLVRRL